jgi:hypothetical protein
MIPAPTDNTSTNGGLKNPSGFACAAYVITAAIKNIVDMLLLSLRSHLEKEGSYETIQNYRRETS